MRQALRRGEKTPVRSHASLALAAKPLGDCGPLHWKFESTSKYYSKKDKKKFLGECAGNLQSFGIEKGSCADSQAVPGRVKTA